MAVHILANLDAPAFTGVPTADTAAVGTSTTQLATTAFVQQAILNPNILMGASMAETGGGDIAAVAGTHVGAARTVNATASYLAGTLGPFPAGGTITGFKLVHCGETADAGSTVDIAVYIGANDVGDDLASPNENNKGTVGAPWALATPAAAFTLTEEDENFTAGTLTVAAGDTVSVWIYRNGTADAYNYWWDVYSIELVWA